MPLIIDDRTEQDAVDAIRDIVLLYIELAQEGGFTHNAGWSIRFDCLRFIDAPHPRPTGATWIC